MESHGISFYIQSSFAAIPFLPSKAPVSVNDMGGIKPDTEGRFLSNLEGTASDLLGQLLYWLPSVFIALSICCLIGLLFAKMSKDDLRIKGRFYGALVFYVMSFTIPTIVFLAESKVDLYVLFLDGLDTIRMAGVGAALLAVFISWRFYGFGFQLIGHQKYQQLSKNLLWTGVGIGCLAFVGPFFLP